MPPSGSQSRKQTKARQSNGQNKGAKGGNQQDPSRSGQADSKSATDNQNQQLASLEGFSKRANELRGEISQALERQTQLEAAQQVDSSKLDRIEELRATVASLTTAGPGERPDQVSQVTKELRPEAAKEKQPDTELPSIDPPPPPPPTTSANLSNNITSPTTEVANDTQQEAKGGSRVESLSTLVASDGEDELGEFQCLSAQLDSESKCAALMASLRKSQLGAEGQPLEALLARLCRKLVELSERVAASREEANRERTLRNRLEHLCRELQKSNNAIRIESLSLIKAEQSRAKEQAARIQETLAGVMKLFEENQQRNAALRQENQDLQVKLRALLEHCKNWETSVDGILKERELANKLAKTELARAKLVHSEEKERALCEKRDLLKLMGAMREQQARVQSEEVKLRQDLSGYAAKYDQCRSVISDGMGKFQIESKRMLEQMEQSRRDYRSLLAKYESTAKRLAGLLEEKRNWQASSERANRKIEALEGLCRALRKGAEPEVLTSPTKAKDNVNVIVEPQPIATDEQSSTTVEDKNS